MPVVINGTTGIDGPNTGGDTLINGVTVGKGAGDIATNTAMGVSVLASNTSGAQNTAFGTQALTLNTSASNNTAFGYQAGYSNTTGFGNVFVGNFAGYSSATVNYQTAFGYGSLQTSTGGGNTAIGVFALNAATTGTSNTAVGPSSGSQITTGSKNTILGGFTGNQNNLDIRTASNRVVLSDGDGYPVWATYGSQGAIVTRNPNTSGQIYAWQRMEGKAVVRGTLNGTGTLLTVGSYSGNNRVYVRVRYMATSAVSNSCGAAVAYAYIDAANFASNAVSAFTTENNVVGGMPSASLSWSSGVLQMTLSAPSNYQGYITTVDVVQWDGNASITFNTSVEVFG